ncbi:MAG: hypothetical protein ACTSYC_06210 [Promethearchaeota archaeon]
MTTRKNLIIPIFYLLLTIGYFLEASYIILNGGMHDYIPAIPGNARIDIFILFIGIPILTCVPLLFINKLALFNFKILKKIQSKFDLYFIEQVDKPIASRHLILRALIPVLVVISISLSLFHSSNNMGLFGTFVTPIINISLLLTPLIIIPFLPIWLYKDMGIVKLLRKQKTRIPPELSYFGKTQEQWLKGYGGITTPILYAITIIQIVSVDIVGIVILVYPLFLIGLYMPMMLIYEFKVRKFGEKLKKTLNLKPLTMDIVESVLE